MEYLKKAYILIIPLSLSLFLFVAFFVSPVKSYACTPGESEVCPSIKQCTSGPHQGEACASGHKYCTNLNPATGEYDNDVTPYWTDCVQEVDNCGTQCTSATVSPTGSTGNCSGNANTKCGSIPWSTVSSELKSAGYGGPFDCSQTELDSYNGVKVCEGTSPTGSQNGSCPLSGYSVDNALATCIASKDSSLPGSIKKLGSDNGQDWSGCSNQQLIAKWCTDINSSGCNDYKNGACASGPTATPTVAVATTEYRISETRFGRSDSGTGSPQWVAYNSDDGSEPITVPYTFTNGNPGDTLTLWVQFKDNKGDVTEPKPYSIKYIGPDPKITSASCTFDPSGQGTLVTLTGSNFNTHDEQGTGGVKINGQQADIISWGEDTPGITPTGAVSPTMSVTPTTSVSPTARPGGTVCAQVITSAKNATGTECKDFPTPCDVPAGWVVVNSCSGGSTVLGESVTRSKVVAKIKDQLPGNARVPLLLTMDDGRAVTATCSINTTTVSFQAKIGCRTSGDYAENGVNINIMEDIRGAKPLVRQKVNIDAAGNLPSDFAPVLEVGKKYKMLIKAPNTPTRRIEFTPSLGSNILSDVSMDVGDIAPAGHADGKINALDKSELAREFSAGCSTTTAKAGDFNQDGCVNALDWSCMRENINKEDEDTIQ